LFACSLFFSVRFVAVQLGPVQQRAGESVRRAAQVRVARARQAASVDGQAEARTAAPGGWLRLPPPLLDLMESWIKALKTIVQMLCITRLELRAKWMASGGGVRYFLLRPTRAIRGGKCPQDA